MEPREDSPLHRGVFLRRAMEMLDTGGVEPKKMQLPRLMNLLRFGESIQVSEAGEILVTVPVQPRSGLDGKTVAETLGQTRGLTAVAVIRGSDLLAPRGDTRFEPGDQLLAMTHPDVHSHLLMLVAGPDPETDTPFSNEETAPR